jgi:hypothetical protein
MDEPLTATAAKKLIQAILKTTDGGTPPSVALSGHAQKEMANDKLIAGDIINVLRGGVVEPAEFEKGSWRYRVRTNKIVVVVCFRSEIELGVVTCWRIKK